MTRSASSGAPRSAKVRCGIYTRKSSEEGLEQEFNSLQAQPRSGCSSNRCRRASSICLIWPITNLNRAMSRSSSAATFGGRARRFNAALIGSDDVPFAALAKREGVSPSYFTRLLRLSYLAPDITQAILDGRQPRGLTADKLLTHSRLPLAWHEQRIALGFA
jgi:hypothetical protein